MQRERFTNNSSVTSYNNWGLKLVDRITDDGFLIDGSTLIKYRGEGGDIVIPNGVTQIESNVFYSNSKIKSVIVPEGVTLIGESSFEDSGIKRLSLPASLKTIGERAFYSCYLDEVNIADLESWCRVFVDSNKSYIVSSPTENAKRLLLNNQKIYHLQIPEGITTIDSRKFTACVDAVSITVPSSVTSITSTAFKNICVEAGKFVNNSSLDASANSYWGATICTQRTDDGFVINNGVLVKYTEDAKDVVIPSSVVSISSCVFSRKSMESVVIPNSVTTLCSSCFEYCKNLKSLVLPGSLQKLESSAFQYCSSLQSVELSDKVNLNNSSIFRGCTSLVSINLPSSVKSIGTEVFASATSLREVTFPDNLTGIYSRAFSGCTSLAGVSIPATVSQISEDAFNGCYFQNSKFNNYSSLEASANSYWGAKLYDTMTEDGLCILGNTVVSYRGTSESIIIPDGIKVIGKSAFEGNKTLTSVTLPDDILEIGESAFSGAINLSNLKIPVSVTELPNKVFRECNSLVLRVPNSVTTIGTYALSGVKDVILPKTMNMLYHTGNATSVDGVSYIPNSVNYVGRETIYDTSVIIEDGEGTLRFQDRNAKDGYYASALDNAKSLYVGKNTYGEGSSYAGELLRSNLTKIVFGPKVTEAFTSYYNTRTATSVQTITCLSKVPYQYGSFPTTALVLVPFGCKQAYKADNNWSTYEIVEVTSVQIDHQTYTELYTPDYDIDLTGIDNLKAYIVSQYNNSKVKLSQVTKIHAGEGVILEGPTGSYTVPCSNLSTTADTRNFLVGTISGRSLTASDEGNKNYLMNINDGTLEFVLADESYPVQLTRNSAYLSFSSGFDTPETILLDEWKVMGDINDSGEIEDSDIESLRNIILKKQVQPQDLSLIDMNEDNNLTVADLVILIDIANGKQEKKKVHIK